MPGAALVHASSAKAALAEQLPALTGSSRRGVSADPVINAASEQAIAVADLLALLPREAVAQLCGTAWEPAALVTWLGTVASMQALTTHRAVSPGCAEGAFTSFIRLTGSLLMDAPPRLAQALAADAAAQAGLLDMLLGVCLPKVCTAQQVADGEAGSCARVLMGVVCVLLSLPGLQPGLAARVARWPGGVELIDAAAGIAAALPAAPGAAASAAERRDLIHEQAAAAELLCRLCTLLHEPAGSSSGGRQRLRQMQEAAAWRMVRLWPPAARTLDELLADEAADAALQQTCCHSYGKAMQLLDRIDDMRSAEQLEAWAAAVEAAAGVLPRLAACSAAWRQPRDGRDGQPINSAGYLAENLVVLLMNNMATDAYDWARTAHGVAAETTAALAVKATPPAGSPAWHLWRAHSATCRVIHWGALPGNLERLPEALDVDGWGQLANGLHMQLVALQVLLAPEGRGVVLPPRYSRGFFGAVCAADVAACQALEAAAAAGRVPQPLGGDSGRAALGAVFQSNFVAGLGVALRVCPQLADPACLELLRRAATCAAGPKNGSPQHLCVVSLLSRVARYCGKAPLPRLAASLAVGGLLEDLLQDAAALERAGRADLAFQTTWDAFDALRAIGEGAHAVHVAVESDGALRCEQAVQVLARLDTAVCGMAAVQMSISMAHGVPPLGFPPPPSSLAELTPMVRQLLPAAKRVAEVLLEYWQLPQQAAAAQVELAQAAACRSCSYLRCSNAALHGGPAAGEGAGCKRCSACRTARYCGEQCSRADWVRGGHKKACAALAAQRGASASGGA